MLEETGLSNIPVLDPDSYRWRVLPLGLYGSGDLTPREGGRLLAALTVSGSTFGGRFP
jgi:hypothetical protein